MQTHIEIFDDEVNEASEQDFIAYLEVIEAVNMSLIQILPVTLCRIIDNDGKCMQQGLTIGVQGVYNYNCKKCQVQLKHLHVKYCVVSHNSFGCLPVGLQYIIVRHQDLASTSYRNTRTPGCSVPSAARALLGAQGFLQAVDPVGRGI